MDGFKLFLESSTIHGLTYVSTTRRLTRIFWVMVVLGGFSCALYLIHESFQSWTESPISTNIETLPIRKIRFPKVTVCPPKNTYTDLNYDLIMAKNITISYEKRLELFKYAMSMIDDLSYMDKLNMLHEDYRFYNWYYSLTAIDQPKLDEDEGLMTLNVDTSALAGNIYTQYFGYLFQKEKVANKVRLTVTVNIPKTILTDTNVTLHFNIEKQSMLGISDNQEQYMLSLMDGGVEDPKPDVVNITRNFTPPRYYEREFGMKKRDVKISDIDALEMYLMPGFKFSWFYTGNQYPPEVITYQDFEIKIYKEFVKKVFFNFLSFLAHFYRRRPLTICRFARVQARVQNPKSKSGSKFPRFKFKMVL